MKRAAEKCPQCGATVSLSNIAKHKISKSCANGGKNLTKKEMHPWQDWQQPDGFFLLPDGYRGTKSACRNYLNHLSSIKRNGPNGSLHQHISDIQSGRKKVHNKGKPLSFEQRGKISEANKKYYQHHRSPEKTEAEKRVLSEKKKAFFQARPELHPNRLLAGNRNKMTYPEKVAFDWFARHGIPAEHNKPIGRFYPDFTLGTVIVEIDGERWHSKPEHVARDQARDATLTAMGYTIHRIPSKDRIEDALARIFLSDNAQAPD